MRILLTALGLSALLVVAACSSSNGANPVTEATGSAGTSAAPTVGTASVGSVTGTGSTLGSAAPTTSGKASTTATTAGGGGTVSQADFDAKAKDLCQTFTTQANSLFTQASITQADFDHFIAFLRDFETKLKAIGIPPGKEQASADFLAAWDQYIDTLQANSAALVNAGTSSPPSSLQSAINDLNAKLDTTSKAFGLEGCGSNG